MAALKLYEAPDGTHWGAEVSNPGASNALVTFHHPNGRTAGLDRYAWYISRGPESKSVTARLSPKDVLDGITDEELAKLFRRSMPVSRAKTPYASPANFAA
jgi:hypothetical protein